LKPARPAGDQSLMDVSVQKLADYMRKLDTRFALTQERAFVVIEDYNIPGAKAQESLPALEKWLEARLG
jgi:hypothetical protein